MGESTVSTEIIDQPPDLRASWRPWREITLIMLMIMEVCWVVPWYRSLTPATFSIGISKAFIIFFSMILAAHLIVRFVNYLRLKLRIRQIIMILSLVISLVIGLKTLLYSGEIGIMEFINQPIQNFADRTILIPDEFIVAIAVIIGWWRGISLAQAHVGPNLVLNNFFLGIFMFFTFGFINTIVTGEAPGFLLYIFIFACLLAMSSARMSIIHLLRGGATVFNRRWLVGIVFAALTVVFLTIVSTSILGEETGIVDTLITSFIYIITLLAYLIFSPLIILFVWLFENFPIRLEIFEGIVGGLNNFRIMMQQALSQLGDSFLQTGIPEAISKWGPNIKALLLWVTIILAICGVGVWVGIRLWKAQNKKAVEEQQQSLLDAKDLWKLLQLQLMDKLKSLWKNLPGLNLLSNARRFLAAERIRQIYIEMLDLCHNLNLPRPEAATPIEFMPAIKKIFPDHVEEIEIITFAYTRIRYGQLPEQRSEVNEVEDAWNRLEQNGRLLIQSEKSRKKPPTRV